MDALLSLAKLIDAPGSIQFFIICIIVGFVLLFIWPRNRRLGRAWLFFISASYVLLGLPIVANAIVGQLPRFELDEIPDDRPLDALIVFDGDNRRGRVAEAARVFAVHAPRHVWVLGGDEEWLLDELPLVGIPPSRLRHDTSTLTTRDQIAWVRRFLSERPGSQIALVASRLQMPRVAALAASAGIDVPFLPSPIDDEPPVTGAKVLVPMYIALRISRDALYEHAAIVYYRRQGWIGR
jgi:uncharacterized SAM-binding protein YcdF (DUF218 family)